MRTVATVLVTLCVLLALGTPALAHNVLISSDPVKGASLDTGPSQITLTFDQYIQSADVNQIAISGPGRTQWADGPVRVDGTVATVGVAPLGPAGDYTVGYRILSADGHSVSGEVVFTLTKAGTGTAVQPPVTTAPAEEDPGGGSGGLPVWAWIAAAVALLAGGLVLALRLGKQAP